MYQSQAHVPNALHLTHGRTFPCPSFLRLTFQKSAPRCERFFMHFSPGAWLHLWWCRSPGMGDWVQERKTEICSLRFFEPEGFWVQKARFTNQIQRIFTNSIVFRYSRGFFKNCSLWQSLLWAQRRILKK